MNKSIAWRIVIIFCLLMFLPACNGGKKVSADTLRGIREGMSERDVVDLLGRPDRVNSQHDKAGKLKTLYYTLENGRKWVIVINEHNETIGSGETMGGAVAKNQ